MATQEPTLSGNLLIFKKLFSNLTALKPKKDRSVGNKGQSDLGLMFKLKYQNIRF